jgi:two-component system, OmpR family, sensor histidine kinase KdpD
MRSAATGALREDACMTGSADARALAFGCLGIGFFTWLYRQWPQVSNATTVALSFLVVVLFVAAAARLWVAVTTSVVSVFALNFFFLPPVGTLTIVDPQNWIALIAFLAVSLVASNLSAVARDRTREAVTHRDEVARLFDLSRDVLLITDGEAANSSLAAFIARRFDLDYVAICVPQGAKWIVFESGSLGTPGLEAADLPAALGATAHDGSAAAPGPATHRTVTVAGRDVRVVPLNLGTKQIGLVATAGRAIETGSLDALAGLVAIAIERAQFLDQRKNAELARQREELKSALLASLAHDLRTPLTAIRVAADNLRSSWPDEQERQEQSELIVTEVDRLTRLFQNILEMARIDAGAVAPDARWVAPSEIVDAARSRVEPALRGHAIDLSAESDRLVRLDPRVTAAALSQLLENAARYSPYGSPIQVDALVTDAGLTIAVRDHGTGIAPSDLPHVFERFYRGASAKADRSGTGMGLAIARGLLAVEQGNVSAENCPDGGARFTILVPADVK